jgi:methylenetetrahydrofolate dehydrogenase (NADP+) / methenyltetrahydrofolate cyclohydrolase
VAATLVDGRAVADRVRTRVAGEVAELGDVGLATVLVGDDPASDVYIRLKQRAAEEAGIHAVDHRLPAETAEAELLDLLGDLNADDAIDGVLVQTPLPAHIDQARVMRAIDPTKDVDGLHPFNAGQLFFGQPTLVGATPLGIMELLREHQVQLTGARAVVVGRSAIVGKPTVMLLEQANATVTICHSRTRDLGETTREADVLVAATGRPRMIGPEMVKPGAAVIDVGITRTDDGLVGDVDPAVADVAGLLTPVPGGVGPMTIAMLLSNAARAARYRRAILAFPQT